MKTLISAICLATLILTSGCASITGTTLQNFSIQTVDKDAKEVKGAACELSNSKGKWFLSTPGSTTINRSNDNLTVVCQKDGTEPGRASVVSATKGSMFGNIIFGGGIGAIVDHNNGSAYEYPAFVQVMMGLFKTIEPTPAAQSAEGGNSANPPSATVGNQPGR